MWMNLIIIREHHCWRRLVITVRAIFWDCFWSMVRSLTLQMRKVTHHYILRLRGVLKNLQSSCWHWVLILMLGTIKVLCLTRYVQMMRCECISVCVLYVRRWGRSYVRHVKLWSIAMWNVRRRISWTISVIVKTCKPERRKLQVLPDEDLLWIIIFNLNYV